MVVSRLITVEDAARGAALRQPLGELGEVGGEGVEERGGGGHDRRAEKAGHAGGVTRSIHLPTWKHFLYC